MTDEFEKRAEEVKSPQQIAEAIAYEWEGWRNGILARDGQYPVSDFVELERLIADAITRERQRGEKKWMQENERYHAMRWELHQEMEKLRAAGPRVVTEEELERMADEFDPPEGWREDDRDGTSFKIGFRKAMELNARAEIERLLPSDKEIMDEARGFPDTARGFLEGVRWLRRRLLGEEK